MMKALFPEITVNGDVISQETIAEEVQNHPVEGNKPGLVWRRAAQALIIRKLLLEEAIRRDIKTEAERKGEGIEEENEALIRALVEEEIDESLFDDHALECEYKKRKHSLKGPAIYGLSHILFSVEDIKSSAQIEEDASAVLAELQNSPERFNAVAASRSDCPSSKNSGYLGQMIEKDFVPEFRAILTDLNPGVVHPYLARSRFGFHILRLEQKIDGKELPEDYAKKILRENLEKYAWVVCGQKLVKSLFESATIEGIKLENITA